jgi:archaeosine synthase
VTSLEVKQRDGPARISVFRKDDESFLLPAALDTDRIFPDLTQRPFSNVPLSAPEKFVHSWFSPGAGQPVALHPALDRQSASSGDCVMMGGLASALKNPRDYVGWLARLKGQVPPDTAWYAPAVALPSNLHLLCYSGFDLFDFTAVDLETARHRFCLPEGEFQDELLGSGVCGCEGCREGDLFRHNRMALEREFALIRSFISGQQLRELVESRSRMHSGQVSILRFLDRQYDYLEERTTVARNVRLGAMTGEVMGRPEVRRFADRVLHRYIPPRGDVAILLPCSAKKPYSLSQSHRKFQAAIAGRAVELIVTSPLGLVPRELERIYPAAHYDIPVTGYWDREELAITAETLADFFSRHTYRRVLAHLDGGALEAARMASEKAGIELEVSCRERPASGAALRDLDEALDGEKTVHHDIVRGTLSWQFGVAVNTSGMAVRWKFPGMSVSRGREPLFSLDPGTGLLRPTFGGWGYIPGVYRVFIDDFPVQGDVLAPGVLSADPRIRENDEVLVEGPQALATGRAAMPGKEMEASSRGVAVRVRKVKRKQIQ